MFEIQIKIQKLTLGKKGRRKIHSLKTNKYYTGARLIQ